MELMYAAAATAEEDRGWGGIVAMVLAVGAYAAIRYGIGRLRERLDGPPAEDDDEDLDDVDGEVLVDEPAPARTPWWRGVVDGLWDKDPEPLPYPTATAASAKNTQATDAVTADDTTGDSTADDGHGHIVTLADGRRVRAYLVPAAASVTAAPDDGAVEEDADLDEWAATQLAAGLRTTDIVTAGREHGWSESTVYRALRRARQP